MQSVKNGSKISVRVFEEKDAGLWDSFVGSSINGTIFHRRKFLGYHSPDRFKDSSLLFFDRNTLVGVFPAAIMNDGEKKILKSHPGSSFGSIIVGGPPGIAMADEMVRELVRFASNGGFSRIEFRLPPRIYSVLPAEEIEFAYRMNGFFIRDVELATCYPIAKIEGGTEDEQILKTFEDACRRSTVKAMRSGLEARLCHGIEDFAVFWEILAQNLLKHKTKPTHSKEELIELKKRFPGDVQLIGVFYELKMIAGVVIFVVNPNAAHVFYFASLYDYQNLRGVNLAVLRLIQFAATRKLKYVNFGISTEKGGTAVNWGLFRFKESFGGHGVTRTYWVKELP